MQKRWHDNLYYVIEDMVRQGMSKSACAKALGICDTTLDRWIKMKPVLAQRIKSLKSEQRERSRGGTETFFQYVHQTLPPELADLWAQIMDWEHHPNRLAAINRILEGHGVRQRQHLFIHALVKENFNATEAARLVGIAYQTVHHWLTDDPVFQQLYDHIMQQSKGDFFESSLMRLVSVCEPSAVIFANRTFNRGRGYGEKVDVNIQQKITVEVIDPAELQLPNEVLKQILQAYREKHAPNELPPIVTTAKRIENKHAEKAPLQ